MAVIGPLTLKMWLFALMLLYTAWSLVCFDRIRLGTILLTASFAALLCLGGMNGVAHGANMEFLGEDVSPLLSFLALPFFELTMRTRQDILLVIRIVVIAAIVMACCYAVIVVSLWLSLWLGVASLGTLYEWLAMSAGPTSASAAMVQERPAALLIRVPLSWASPSSSLFKKTRCEQY